MNTNELVKELKEDSHDYAMGYLNEAADLILKQQAKIEALKAKIDGLDMVIWKLQNTLTNRELRTYDGKALEK